MALTERLAYILSADSTQAVVGFDRAARSADAAALAEGRITIASDKLAVAEAKAAVNAAKAAGDTDKLTAAQTRLGAAQAKLSTSRSEQAVVGAKGELAAAEKGLDGVASKGNIASRALGQLGLSGVSGPLAAAGAITAAGAVVEKFGEASVHAFVDLASSVRQYRAVAGGSAEDASRMVAAFDALGVPVEQASGALFKMGANVQSNAKKLEEHGVVIARDAQGNVDLNQTLTNVVSAYQHSTDASEKDFIAKTAMGKGAQALIPLLNASAEEMKKFGDAAANRGEILHDKDLESARNLQIAMKELSADAKAFETNVGKAIVPVLVDAAKGADRLVKDFDHLTASVGGLGGVFRGIISVTPLGSLVALGKGTKSTAGDTADLTDKTAALAQAQLDETNAADEATAGLDKMISSLRSEQSAQDAVATATKAVATAREESAKKARDESDAVDQMRKADESLTRAEHDLAVAKREAPENRAKAILDERDATFALADAERAYTVAVEKFGATSAEAQKADIARERAKFGVADATQKAKDLEAAGDHPQTVLDAEQRVAEAKKAQATAAQAKTKADQEDPVADLAKAEGDLKDKTLTELVTRQKLKKELEGFNSQFGQTLTMADLLNGKADELLTKLARAQAEASQGFGTFGSGVGPNPYVDAPATPGKGPLPWFPQFGAKPGPSGANAAAASAASAAATINVGPVYNNDPNEIAKAVAFAFRAR